MIEVAAERDEEMADIARLLVSTGMRRGELLALRWCDLDATRREVTVLAATVDGGVGVGVVRAPTKTSDWRDVPLTNSALAALERQRSRCDELLVLSVDLGGTNMRAAVVNADGEIQLRVTEVTPRDARCPDALEQLMTSVRDEGGGRGSFEAIVIGVPGRVDYCAGRLEHAPNLPPTWLPELTETRLAAHFDAPMYLANDADLAAVGEAYYGAGHPYTDVVYITISTGIGAGVVLDGKLRHGTRSLAEIGHTIIAVDHLNTGEPATAEHLAAGPALDRNAAAAGVAARGAELVELVVAGDPSAGEAWDQTMQAAAATVVNLAHVFSPDAIVVGGGVGRHGVLVQQPLTAMLERHGPQGLEVPIAIVEAALGDDPGLIGGAIWPLAVGGR